MSQQVDYRDFSGSSGYGSSHESGSRRRKFAGYLKAANELRQSYQQAYGLGAQQDGEGDEHGSGSSGPFPDLAVVRNGDEEMLLFPSYARQHRARKTRPLQAPGASDDIRSGKGAGDSEYWKREWEKYEEGNSIVDVDVRGWVYAPHRGAMTRKNRVLMGLARHLSGIPAPPGGGHSRASSPLASQREKLMASAAAREEELMEKEADSILRRGEGEAYIARQGGYSENPGGGSDGFHVYGRSNRFRTPSRGTTEQMPGQFSRRSPSTSPYDSQDDAPGPGFLEKRASWNQPSDMSPAELSVANAHLMARLKPFLTTPLASIPLTVFFYNEDTSRSRTVTTDESGHFSLRAPLDFVPTNVRVLASEKLSATEEVRITGPTGVSVISDIDDTIKHSAISSGAKEIFRNTFIRDLGDLHIEGVQEWYSKMADLGAKFHYVSNSPWQLFPVLVTYFAGAGLPKGSFHLKQYSGMLQGIFEPVAERKKGTLERIMQDFPKRRFILVGDSGEADLELYTELVLASPRRILGVFIRDVTTTKHQGFFDSSMGAVKNNKGSNSPLRGRQSDGGSPSFNVDRPPTLPPRQQTRSTSTLGADARRPTTGKLVDFDEEPKPGIKRAATDSKMEKANFNPSTSIPKPSPPSRPSKPISLQSYSSERTPTTGPNIAIRNSAPPPPPKPRKFSSSQDTNQPTEPSPLSHAQNISASYNRDASLERQGYRSAVRNKVASAYNALPSWYASQPQPSDPPASQSHPRETPPGQKRSLSPSPSTANSSSNQSLPPPIPPRRNLSSYPAAAAHYATNRLNGGWSGNSNPGATSEDVNGNPANAVVNKKEDLWNRRWARAQEIFQEKGVLLRSWRSGGDVIRDAVRLVENAQREDQERLEKEVVNKKGQ
ncbi:hypothetical protein MMC29_008311 [Sticta canariensis]|nr:hypothetical protein [Sticta canariensis]